MLQAMHARPFIIAERHHASVATYELYRFLKDEDSDYELNEINYILYEGAPTPEEHIKQAENAYKLYRNCIKNHLEIDNDLKIDACVLHDLEKNISILQNKSLDKIVGYAHGFGQLRNLSVHYLLYQLLEPFNVEWVSIDSERRRIKEFAKIKVRQGRAYLYKKHSYIGKVKTLEQKTLLEAAIIRSKYMADYMLKYARTGKAIGLLGARHCYDIAMYTPDLADIIGYNPLSDYDQNLYHYITRKDDVEFLSYKGYRPLNEYMRSVESHNTQRLTSTFGLRGDYMGFIDQLNFQK